MKDSKCFKIIRQWFLEYLGPIHSSLQCQGKDSGVLGGRQAGTLNRYSGALSLKSFWVAVKGWNHSYVSGNLNL